MRLHYWCLGIVTLLWSAWSAWNVHAADALPVTLDPTQTWVGEVIRQGGLGALALYVIYIQNRDHRAAAERRKEFENRLLDQLAASTAAVTAANHALARLASQPGSVGS